MRRKNEIKVRLDDRELTWLNEVARRAGRSRESCIRDAIVGIQIREAPSLEYHTLIREMRAVGNNLNQLAVIAHSKGFIDGPALRQALMDLREAECKLQAKA